MANINDPKIRAKYLKNIVVPEEVEAMFQTKTDEKAQYRNYDNNLIEKLRERAKEADEKAAAAQPGIGNSKTEDAKPVYIQSETKVTQVAIVSIEPQKAPGPSGGCYDEFTFVFLTLSKMQRALLDYVYKLCKEKNFTEPPMLRASEIGITLGSNKEAVTKIIKSLVNKKLLEIKGIKRGRGGFYKLSIDKEAIPKLETLLIA